MATEVFTEADIRAALCDIPRERLIGEIELGFVAHSAGRAVVPPIAEMSFDEPPGDVHVKYGYLLDDPCYVIKVASGFYENPQRGLLVSQGMMLVFDRQSGLPFAVLLDGGYLTRIRTAVAGAIAAKWLAPSGVLNVGIVGSGVQARLQLMWLRCVADVGDVCVLSRSRDSAVLYQREMGEAGLDVGLARDEHDLAERSNVIVTTTPAKKPLLHAASVRRGTHITAIGSDTFDKQELDPAILARADLLVTDSRDQAQLRGEIAHALKEQVVGQGDVLELGEVISAKVHGRGAEEDLTVADLTGLAVQDIQIAKAVCRQLGLRLDG